MAVTTHLCRGNFRSSWAASGGYDFVAEALFSELNVDGFFLEYDDERSGGFEPLRFVPPGKMVVLGLVTTKRGELENPDALKRRIEEAARFVPLDQLCLSAAVRLLLDGRGQRAELRRGSRQARADRQRRPRRLGLRIDISPNRCHHVKSVVKTVTAVFFAEGSRRRRCLSVLVCALIGRFLRCRTNHGVASTRSLGWLARMVSGRGARGRKRIRRVACLCRRASVGDSTPSPGADS